MVTAELLAARRQALERSADLQGLLATLARRTERVLREPPAVPPQKALLSQDGGICPDDGTALAFDPWSPAEHRCPRCGRVFQGERHDRAWARSQHLWLAERAADLAAVAALGRDGDAAAAAARALLSAYGARYFAYPNRDNVLGPARLFFSTYLESLWLTSYLAAAAILRAADRLDEATTRAVNAVADEAANLIGEFDERWSNRQTWNNAALTAIATWFEDADLLQHAVGGATGLAAHLLEGFRPDGLWYEGENYHLFALRGLLVGLTWSPDATAALLSDPRPRARLAAALLAPTRSALPDFTFPARKDSRFGVSLAQPMYLETWEVGLGVLGSREPEALTELSAWLRELYRATAPPAQHIDCYLHESGDSPRSASASPAPPRTRRDLSWWAGLTMFPDLPADRESTAPPRRASILFENQGLAILRTADRYVSLECGPYAGGHAHPDRLHLTLHDGRVHWLADPGTGSYVSRDLFWYRGTLAHNAPRIDGTDQTPGSAECRAFEETGDWGWVRATFGEVTRTVLSGPDYVLDLVELAAPVDHMLEVPWHCAGRLEVRSPGSWRSDALAGASGEFTSAVEAFVPRDGDAPIEATATSAGGELRLCFLGVATLLVATGPGRPGAPPERFFVARAAGRTVRLLTVLAPAGVDVTDVRWTGDLIEVVRAAGVDRHQDRGGSWQVEPADAAAVTLAGPRERPPAFTPFLVLEPPEPVRGQALAVSAPPACDGSFEGFDLDAPLVLDEEDQYRRSEEPWPGAEELRATAWVNWDDAGMYVAVDIVKPVLWFRPGDAAPLRLDNEPDDVHSDGVQIYVRGQEGQGFTGYVIVPEDGGRLRLRPVPDTAADPAGVRGGWARTEAGYRVTVAIPWPPGVVPHPGGAIGFDLLVNEMTADRQRRAGQLVWSGGNGWVWLRGDRQAPDRLGLLELIG